MKKILAALILISASAISFKYLSSAGLLTSKIRLDIPKEVENILKSDNILPEPLKVFTEARLGNLTYAGVISETNLNRKKNGLPRLYENAQLNKTANLKLKDLFANQYFEHISPAGLGPSDLAKQSGYAYILVGENLALGNFKDDRDVVTAWMNSPGHRANILHARFTEIGVAVGKGRFDGKDVWIAVQSFGLPITACPKVDAELLSATENNKQEIARKKAELDNLQERIKTSSDREEYNRLVQEFNALVAIYNNLVDKTKALVEEYNKEVQALNACAKK